MSLTQRFGTYLHSSMQAIKQASEKEVAIRTIQRINKISKAEIKAIFTEMVQTIDDSTYSAELESESSYFKGGYKQYGVLSPVTVKRKSYYTKDDDAEYPLRYRGYFKNSPDSLMAVMTRMSIHNQLSNRLFEAFGGYNERSYRTENREVAINENLYKRTGENAGKVRSRTRWSDIVDPSTVAEIRRNADKYVFVRGDITKTGFYDAVNKRHISLERAIAEGRVKHPVRVRVESKLFQNVKDTEYGFTLAIIPAIAQYSSEAAEKVGNLYYGRGRIFVDIFFASIFERIYDKLKKVDPAFKTYDPGPL